MVRWEILERIGSYAAGELSGEEAYETERFILENDEGRRLAESYAHMLTLLGAIGKESPAPPGAIVEEVVRRVYRNHAWSPRDED
jgi:hypothetical protein